MPWRARGALLGVGSGSLWPTCPDSVRPELKLLSAHNQHRVLAGAGAEGRGLRVSLARCHPRCAGLNPRARQEVWEGRKEQNLSAPRSCDAAGDGRPWCARLVDDTPELDRDQNHDAPHSWVGASSGREKFGQDEKRVFHLRTSTPPALPPTWHSQSPHGITQR